MFLCLTLSVFSTIEDFEKTATKMLFYMESVAVVWFAVEFSLRYFFFALKYHLLINRKFRLWSSGCRSRYQGYIGRLKFIRRPFCIIGELLLFLFPALKLYL